MHINGGLTLAKAGSLALRTTGAVSVATNNPVAIVWGAREGNLDTRMYTHNLGSFTITVNQTGRYKIAFNMNVRMTGSSLSTASRTDTVVAFIAVNNQTVSRSQTYGAPYQQSGGYVTLSNILDNIQLNAGATVVLYVYRLITTGTISTISGETNMTIEMVTKG